MQVLHSVYLFAEKHAWTVFYVSGSRLVVGVTLVLFIDAWYIPGHLLFPLLVLQKACISLQQQHQELHFLMLELSVKCFAVSGAAINLDCLPCSNYFDYMPRVSADV